MKKVLTLLCAVVLTISANALPTVKRIQNDVRPILKSTTANNLTTPESLVAFYITGQDYNYQVVFYDATGSVCATAYLKTGSSNSIAGVYDVGVVNNQYNGYVKIKGTQYWIKRGSLTLQYSTTTSNIYVGNVQELMYNVYASGLQLMDTQGNDIQGEYAFSGQVTAFGVANYSNYQSCLQSTTNCESALLQLSEQKINAVEVECDEINYELKYTAAHSDEEYEYPATWTMWTVGIDNQGKYYQTNITSIGEQASGNVGSYASGYCTADLHIADELEGTYQEIEIASAYGTVSKVQNNGLKYDFYLTAKSGTIYHILLYVNVTWVNYMESDVDYFTSFATDHMQIQSGDMESAPGVKWFYVVLNNGKEYAAMYFFANTIDEEITIPARPYMISPSNTSGTVQANTGVESNPLDEPSYIGKVVNANTIDEISFMVDGSVTVTKVTDHAYIQVNAKNSLGRVIKFTVGEPPITGIEEVKMEEVNDGQKLMIDGKLYIKRGDNLYNAQGAVVK